MEKGQAGLRRSQLKMQVCGAWVFWSRGPKEGARPGGKRSWGWERDFSTSEGGGRVET